MVDAATVTIDLGQIITYTIPFILAAVSAVWSAVLLPLLKRHFEHVLSNHQWSNIDRASNEAAGKIWAEAEPSIAHAQITGQDPKVAFAVQTASDVLQSTMKNLGLTPEALEKAIEDKILARLGDMQHDVGQTLPVPVPVVVDPVQGVAQGPIPSQGIAHGSL